VQPNVSGFKRCDYALFRSTALDAFEFFSFLTVYLLFKEKGKKMGVEFS
jgi:hypothetical protein